MRSFRLHFLVSIAIWSLASGAHAETCSVLAAVDLDNVSESDLKEIGGCLSEENKTANALIRYEAALAQVPERKKLLESQLKAYDEAADIRAKVLAEGKEILKVQTDIPSEAVSQLQKYETNLTALDARATKLRDSWEARMKFPSSSPAWRLIAFVNDPFLPEESKKSIRSFKSSFPKSHWGEGKDDAVPLVALEDMLKQAHLAIKSKTHSVAGSAFDSALARIAAKLEPVLIENRAQQYSDSVIDRVRPSSVITRSMLYQMQGLVITPRDQLTESLKAMRLARRRMPKEFAPHTGATLDEWISLVY